MSTQYKSIGPITVVGVELRTTNENGQAFKDIPPFWQQFFKNDIMSKIENKKSRDIYAVYTHFDNEGQNNQGIYSLIIGAAVTNERNIPDGLVKTTIPQSDYQLFSVDPENPGKVGETWETIWQYSFDRERTFKSEFEYYKVLDSGGFSEIGIYIGLK